jgi:hypothetical protein
MTKKGDPNPVVMLNLFQHLVKIFSAFGRRTFHPRPQDGVFRCDFYKVFSRIHILRREKGETTEPDYGRDGLRHCQKDPFARSVALCRYV